MRLPRRYENGVYRYRDYHGAENDSVEQAAALQELPEPTVEAPQKNEMMAKQFEDMWPWIESLDKDIYSGYYYIPDGIPAALGYNISVVLQVTDIDAFKQSTAMKVAEENGWIFNLEEVRLSENEIDALITKMLNWDRRHGSMLDTFSKITTRVIQKLILNLGEDGVNIQTSGGMAPKTIKNYLSFISTIFNYAKKQRIVTDNPCRGVSSPTIQQVERDCFALEEAQCFLEFLENAPDEWRVFCTLAIYSGFRRGELFGLE